MIVYVPLEPYRSRYTEYQSVKDGVFETQFKEAGVEFTSLRPHNKVLDIEQGVIVDYVKRSEWSFKQINQLLKMIASKSINENDAIFFEDFWTPGFEMVPYALQLAKIKTPVYSFCWAQSTDPHDFTAQMASWMRPMEQGWAQYQDKIMCASVEMVNQWRIGDLQYDKLRWVGLPFSTQVLKKKFGIGPQPTVTKVPLVVFSSRWDTEKNPKFFLRLVSQCPSVAFTVCSGLPRITSNSSVLLAALHKALDKYPNLTLQEGLTKREYFRILGSAKVQFNCSYQDFVSFTLLDAVASGCAPLYPNRLTFPDALNRSYKNLYGDSTAFDDRTLRLAVTKLNKLLSEGPDDYSWIVKKYEGSVHRIVQQMVPPTKMLSNAPPSLAGLCRMSVDQIKEYYA